MSFQFSKAAIPQTVIVIPDTPTQIEETAAKELNCDIKQISGANLPIVKESEAPTEPKTKVYIGATKAATKVGITTTNLPEDTIIIKTIDGSLYLTGHKARGPLYAVYTLLEDAIGVRWWTPEASTYPIDLNLSIPEQEICYSPTIRFREVFSRDTYDPKHRSRQKQNFFTPWRYLHEIKHPMPKEYGKEHCLSNEYHSFQHLIPAEKYFQKHPEWFSLVDGKRISNGQLCLTNKEMEAELIKNALELLRQKPDCDFLHIGQCDNPRRCQCANCLALEKEEGDRPSGPMIHLVNHIAEAVEKEFPNVLVDTFAYTYTRQAPLKVQPRDNVTIRLCDIECDFARTLEKSPYNRSFIKDLEDWVKVAKGRLYIWDYVVNFNSLMLPHPNYHVLADNIRTFVKYGASGIFEQGNTHCAAGEFEHYRSWMLAHLLWNPNADEKVLHREFIYGYYGKAGEYIDSYMTLLSECAQASKYKMRCYRENTACWIPTPDLIKAYNLMDQALKEASRQDMENGGSTHYSERVYKEQLGIEYAKLLNWYDIHQYLGIPTDKASHQRAKLEWIRRCRALNVNAHRSGAGQRIIFDGHVDWFLEYEQGLEEGHLD